MNWHNYFTLDTETGTLFRKERKLGRYSSIEEAATARAAFEKELHGEYARKN